MRTAKSFFYALILILIGRAGAEAADVKFGGEFRARGFYTQNLSDARSGGKGACRGPDGLTGTSDDTCNDQEVFNDTRFRLKIMATEGLATGVVRVDFFNDFSGRNAATLNAPTGSGTGDHVLGGEGFGRSLDTVSLKEGYLRVSWPVFHLVIGRQGITLGNGLILDDTADAISAAIPMNWATLTFVSLLLDTDSRGSGNTSAYLSNLNIAPTARYRSSLFIFYLRDRGPNLFLTPCGTGSPFSCALSEFGDDRAALTTFGWSLDYKGSALSWGTELDYLKGAIHTDEGTARNPSARTIDLRGANALGKLGWAGGRFDAGLTALYATGQEAKNFPPGGHRMNINAVSPNYVLGNILVNNETVSDRDGGNIGGLSAAKVSLGWSPLAILRGEVAWIRAIMTERPGPDASKDLGWELDANGLWQIDSNLSFQVGSGILFAGDAWKALMSDPEATDRIIKLSSKLVFVF